MNGLFEKEQPLEIEIGSGKGRFLMARASLHPSINFLGIEMAGKWMRLGMERSEKKGLFNLKFVRGEAREFLEREIPACCVSVFHLYFPDPWPKRRHHRRRLFTAGFLKLLHERLVSGGLIEVATDFEDYYRWISKEVEEAKLPWKVLRQSVNERIFEAIEKTSYETKYEAQGKTLYYLELEKG